MAMKVPVRPTPALCVGVQTKERQKEQMSLLIISKTLIKNIRQRCVCVCVYSVRPAVDHGRRVSGVLVHVLSDQMSEVDEELSSFWYPMIRPGCEVEVTH